MADLTILAFDLADRYRNPVFVAADGFIGQMMEPVRLPLLARRPAPPAWAVLGTPETRPNLVSSIHLSHEALEAHVRKLAEKYDRARSREVRCEEVQTEDAEILLVGYGIVSRVLKRAVVLARQAGIRAGLLRPITLWPFPTERLRDLSRRASRILVVELSTGQMVEDVRLAAVERCPVDFYGRQGGQVPSAEEILERIQGPGLSPATQEVRCVDVFA
jgi:pyruvate/2-oxoacid:ferredoxin oxidoreductase alpha subunit